LVYTTLTSNSKITNTNWKQEWSEDVFNASTRFVCVQHFSASWVQHFRAICMCSTLLASFVLFFENSW